MKKLMCILLILLAFNYPAIIFGEETIVLTNGEFAPYMSKKLPHYGFYSRVVTEAFALEGVKVEYKFMPWKRGYQQTQKGEFDGAVGWTHKPGREEFFYFSDVVLVSQSVYFHLKSYPFDWKTIVDLEGIKLGATLGYNYGKEFEDAEKAGKIKVQWTVSDLNSLKKMEKGRIEVFQLNIDVGYALINENFKPETARLFTHHPKPVLKSVYYLMLSKKIERNKRMLVLFNNGLKRLKESGKYEQFRVEFRGKM